MKTYFICIITSSVISALCTSLASGTFFEKYVKYICSLICVTAVLLPIIPALRSADFDKWETEYSEISYRQTGYTVDMVGNSTEDYMEKLIFEKFGIENASVSIQINSGSDGITIGGIAVTIPEEHENAAEKVADYIFDCFGIKARVSISHG